MPYIILIVCLALALVLQILTGGFPVLFFSFPRTMLSAYIKDTACLLVLEMFSLGFMVYSFTSTTMKT